MIKFKAASNREIYINPNFISSIEEHTTKPVIKIKMSNGGQFIIKEPLAEVLDKLAPFTTGQVVFTTPEEIHRKMSEELRTHGPRC